MTVTQTMKMVAQTQTVVYMAVFLDFHLLTTQEANEWAKNPQTQAQKPYLRAVYPLNSVLELFCPCILACIFVLSTPKTLGIVTGQRQVLGGIIL